MNRKVKRRRKRKLKKWFKIFLISIPVIIVIILIFIYGFRFKRVSVSLDVNQFSDEEMRQYLEADGVENTIAFWLKSKLGIGKKIELLDEYTVSLKSPMSIKITGKVKPLKGVIDNNGIFYYIDRNGKVLKQSNEKLEGIPKVTGLEYEKIQLYQKVPVKNDRQLNVLVKVIDFTEEYDFEIKKINISPKQDISLYIKKVQVDLGKEKDLDKKLETLNNIYYRSNGGKNVFKDKCVLNMKNYLDDGVYIVEYPNKDKKNGNKKKK